MENQITPEEVAVDQQPAEKKRSRYGLWVRITALVLVIAMLLSITSVDFSLMRYQGTDQMAAAQYLMDSTDFLGQSRLQRLKSLLTNVDSYSLHLQAAEIAIGKMDYERAAKYLNKCIDLGPEEDQTGELYNRLGCVYMLAEDPAQALLAFDSSIAMDAENPTPYLLRAQLRYQGGDAAGAAADAAVYLDLGGNDMDMLATAASICELGGDLEMAETAINRKILAAEDDTEKAFAYAERGRVRYLRGLEPEACDDILKAKEMNPGVMTGVHYAILALCEYNSGDYANGREDFRKAAQLSADGNAEYYEQAILCGYLSEDYAFIQETIAEAKQKNMMTASSLLIDGILLFSRERYEEAVTSLTQSVDTGTVVAGAYYYRGLSYLALGSFEEAVADFTEALNWEEDTLSCIFNRGVCYYALEEDEKAIADLQLVAANETDAALALSAQELLDSMESE